MTPNKDRPLAGYSKGMRQRIKLAYPDEFNDGAKRAFTGDKLYPPGFLKWPLERRNAWYAGFNKGYSDRKRGRDDGR